LPLRDAKHLALIRMLPCVMGGQGEVQACHLRKGTDGGMGMKPSDFYTLPLSFEEHAKQHRLGELTYWGGIEGVERARKLAQSLYGADIFKARRLIMEYKHEKIQ